MSDDYDKDTRCKGKANHPKCKTCARRRSGTDANIFVNPPTMSAGSCRFYRRAE